MCGFIVSRFTGEETTYSKKRRSTGIPKSFEPNVLNDILRKQTNASLVTKRRSLGKLNKTGVPSCSLKHEGYVFSPTARDCR
jgi:hypothetical protein